jgi:iron-sulfur cluster repair protein YtfE (RIC family)
MEPAVTEHTPALDQGRFAHAIEVAEPQRRPLPELARHDMYKLVHKGLRAFMGQVLTAAGCMDSDDADEVARVLAQVRGLLDVCRSHLIKENTFVHAAMEARRPGSANRTAEDHVGHEQAFAQLESYACAVELSSGAVRAAAAMRLYRQLALFVAENFEHMHVEETENNAVLWATHTDEELVAIEQAVVASIPPELSAVFLRWMLPYMTPAERAAMLIGMRRAAPAAVFETALATVKPFLSDRDWNKLTAALS